MSQDAGKPGALTPQQRAVLEGKRVQGEFAPTELLALLAPLEAFDEANDARCAKLRKWRKFGIFLLVVAGAVLAFTGLGMWEQGLIIPALLFGRFEDGLEGQVLVFRCAAAVFALALPGVIAGSIRLRGLDRLDVAGARLRQVVLPFLRVIAEDVPDGGKVRVALDASPLLAASKRTARTKQHRGRWTYVDSRYHNDWFAGSAVLANGARLDWQVGDTTRLHDGSHSKGKFKTKRAMRSRLDVTVQVPRRRYAPRDAADPSMEVDDRRIKVSLTDKQRKKDMAAGFRASPMTPPLDLSEYPFDADGLVGLVDAAFSRVRPLAQGEVS